MVGVTEVMEVAVEMDVAVEVAVLVLVDSVGVVESAVGVTVEPAQIGVACVQL